MKTRMFFTVLWTQLFAQSIAAQENKLAEEDRVHDELRALRDGLFEAYEKRDLERLLTLVHPNVVVTWQNAELSRGHEGLRNFYQRMMVGNQRVVESISSKLTIDELSILHGVDTAVAFGSLDDDFKLMNGTQFHLHSRWTATAVKEGDHWLIASFHASANLFDNPLLSAAQQALYLIGGAAFTIGLTVAIVVAWVVGRLRRRPA